MTEEHVMDVRWSGDGVVAEALKAAAEALAHEATLQTDEGVTSLHITVTDSDLQSLRDRVDALLVALGDVEDRHNG